MSEPIKLSGEVELSIRFRITDLAALVKAYPKEWKSLTADRIQDAGHGRDDVERLPVFLDGVLDAKIDVHAFGDEHIRIDVDWDNTDYRWTEEDAAALMEALPPDMRFEEGELVEPKVETPQPMDGDQPLPFPDKN